MAALRIEPVIEVLGDDAFDLWPVVGRGGCWYLALHGDLSDAEVGTAVHQILHWFHTDENGDEAASRDIYLDRALGPSDPDGAVPLATGGLQFTDLMSGETVLPGCCYSIDERSEIVDVLDGELPGCWLGHSPDAGVTMRNGNVEITQDAEDSTRPVLCFGPEEVRAALAVAEVDLDGFCDRAATWAAAHVPAHAGRLAEAVARALEAGSHRATATTSLAQP
ncbi:hypothetical protein [Myceligenerans pegani]|uniref:Uncharacterized protein n=1 Tax=Myceligenerans pegani TaxID=2776917 RepID=A0ABR9N335_9MICO|nr:hypothetical protein [Myceligenerans sp. TRM 65318]MBE1878054.1 hypothetical protein [Myceligenerans sp. TRM 65318]MBE3020325.1 hypothetical protein [Myceligenerans sp. TRM 65318]